MNYELKTVLSSSLIPQPSPFTLHNSSFQPSQYFPRDDYPLDLRAPLADFAELGFPEVALHRKSPRVAVAAMDLDRFERRPHGSLRGEELGHGGLPGKPLSAIPHQGGPVDE